MEIGKRVILSPYDKTGHSRLNPIHNDWIQQCLRLHARSHTAPLQSSCLCAPLSLARSLACARKER
jgi:hypothetical protein